MSEPPERPSNRYAAAILRGVKERIDAIEQAVTEEGIPNILRAVKGRIVVRDEASRTVRESAASSWDTAGDEWDDTAEPDEWA